MYLMFMGILWYIVLFWCVKLQQFILSITLFCYVHNTLDVGYSLTEGRIVSCTVMFSLHMEWNVYGGMEMTANHLSQQQSSCILQEMFRVQYFMLVKWYFLLAQSHCSKIIFQEFNFACWNSWNIIFEQYFMLIIIVFHADNSCTTMVLQLL